MTATIAVIGAAGQLGSEVVEACRRAGHQTLALTRDQLDVTQTEQVAKALGVRPVDAVINCAAHVQVDLAEEDPETAFRVNALGALHVARSAARGQALCVYVSTDYVFDGRLDRPYTEQDLPRPINVYGASKLAGETLVRQACERSLIVRVASLYGRNGARAKGGHILEAVLREAKHGRALRIVQGNRISPTYAKDAAEGIVRLVEHEAIGLVHVTNSGWCTVEALAVRALSWCALTTRLEPCSEADLKRPAKRPRCSALESIRFASIVGEPLPKWEHALKRYLEEAGEMRHVEPAVR